MAVTLSRAARWLGLFDSALDVAAGNRPRTDNPVRSSSAAVSGSTWAIALDEVKDGDEIVVAARFGQPTEALESLLAGAVRGVAAAGDTHAFQEALEQQERAWNERLGRVPQNSPPKRNEAKQSHAAAATQSRKRDSTAVEVAQRVG